MNMWKISITVILVAFALSFGSVANADQSDVKINLMSGAEDKVERTTFDNMIMFSKKLSDQWSTSLFEQHRYDIQAEHVFQDIVGLSLRYTIERGETIGISYSYVETYIPRKADSDRFNFSYSNILHKGKKAVVRYSTSYATGTDWESGKQSSLRLMSIYKGPNKMSTTLGYNLSYNFDAQGVSQHRYDISQRIAGSNKVAYTVKYTIIKNQGIRKDADHSFKFTTMFPIK
ncbi:hypothetical protein ACFLQK_01190 [bacterium]